MIDVENEELISMSEAARMVNRRKPPHMSTLYRWMVCGVRGKKLDTVLVGGARFTSCEAVRAFIAAVNEPRDLKPLPPPPSVRAKAAADKLIKMGC